MASVLDSKRMFSLILLVFVCGSFGQAFAQRADAIHGTAIAAYRTENGIVIAADSKATAGDGSFYVDPICKIRQFGSTFVAASGLYQWSNPDFDLWDIVSIAAFGARGLSDIVNKFERAVPGPLRNAVTEIKNQEPNLYEERHVDKPTIQVFFLGVENNVITLKYREFKVVREAGDFLSVYVKSFDCPGNLCPAGRGVVLVGKMEMDKQKVDEMFKDSFLSRNAKTDTVDLARRFVQMVIDKDPINFGPPIDILSITKDGAKWIQKKETCP